MSARWLSLEHTFPKNVGYGNGPIPINDEEFIMVGPYSSLPPYKYSITTNKWCKITYFTQYLNTKQRSNCFDGKNTIIYINNAPFLQKIDWKTNKIIQMNGLNLPQFYHLSPIRLLYKLHYFDNSGICKWDYAIWNSENKTFEIKLFNDIKEINPYMKRFWTLHLPKRNMMLFILGWQYEACDKVCCVYRIRAYCTLNDKWTSLDIQLPKKFSSICAASSINEQYIFLFGGCEGFLISYLDDIFVIDLYAMTVRKSSIKCPEATSRYGAIVMNDNFKQKLMTNGFIRECYQDESYKTLRHLPYYLIDLVNQFYSIENIHLIRRPSWLCPIKGKYEYGGHFTISVDDIINNLQ